MTAVELFLLNCASEGTKSLTPHHEPKMSIDGLLIVSARQGIFRLNILFLGWGVARRTSVKGQKCRQPARVPSTDIPG